MFSPVPAPNSQFLSGFRQFFAARTDASTLYAEAAGLACLSAISLNRVTLASDAKLNIYLMLAGDSSTARKSTAVEMARAVVLEAEPDRIGPGIFTPEGLFTVVKRRPVLCPISEYGQLLASLTKRHNSDLLMSLNLLWDGCGFEKALKGQTIKIENPAVSVLAGVATSLVANYIERRNWSDGVMARYLVILDRLTDRPPRFTSMPASNRVALCTVAGRLRQLGAHLDAKGLYVMPLITSSPARALFDHIINGWDPGTNIGLGYHDARLAVMLEKIAALYQLDIDPNAPISLPAMQAAVLFVDRARADWVTLSGEVPEPADSAQDTWLLDELRKYQARTPDVPFNRREFYRDRNLTRRMTIKTLNEQLHAMRSLGMVETITVGRQLLLRVMA